MFNQKSKLRRWLWQWFDNFEITALFARHEMESPERVEIWCIIRTLRYLRRPLFTIKVTPLHQGLESQIIRQERLGELAKDTEMRLVIGSIMIPSPGWTPRHSVWGEQYGVVKHNPGLRTMVGKSRNLIEITLGNDKQSFYLELRESDNKAASVVLMREEEVPL
jgi:hypothetical protein